MHVEGGIIVKKKLSINDYFLVLKQVVPHQDLRQRILTAVTEPTQQFVSQLRIATVFSLFLLLSVFSTYITLDRTPYLLTSLDLEPNSYIESVLLSSNGLSQDIVMNTLFEIE